MPGVFEVDAAGKAIAFQLADDFESRRPFQNGGVDGGGSVTDDQAVGVAQSRRQFDGGGVIGGGGVDAAAVGLEPVPVGKALEAFNVLRGQVVLAHPLVAGK